MEVNAELGVAVSDGEVDDEGNAVVVAVEVLKDDMLGACARESGVLKRSRLDRENAR